MLRLVQTRVAIAPVTTWRRIRRMHPAMLCMLLGVALAGCAKGVAEYQLYVKAFNLQYQHGDAVLNSLARAERIVARRHLKIYSGPLQFRPNQAAYYLDNVDPPLTASIRASIKSLKTYNEALAALANGEAAKALTNRIGTLVTDIAGALAATKVPIGSAVSAATGGATSVVSARTLQSALAIIEPLLTFAGREAFRKQLILAYPHMKGLLIELRNGTTIMISVIETSYRSIDRPGISNGNFKKDVELMAGWVLLIDKALVAMHAAVSVAMTEANSATLASLSELSVELRVLAEKIKSIRAK